MSGVPEQEAVQELQEFCEPLKNHKSICASSWEKEP